jgi:arginase
MQDEVIVTPYSLEAPVDALAELVPPGGHLNRPPLVPGGRMATISQLHRPLADRVARAVSRGRRPVSISGDCCTPIAVMAGLQRAGLEPALIWLDAHGDFNTDQTSPSGFIGGMPLAMLTGRGDATLTAAVGLTPLADDRVVLTDARDLDPGERELLRDAAVTVVADVRRLEARLPPDRPLCVHLDTDIVDAGEAPAMLYPVPGGPSLAIMRDVLGALAATGRVQAVSMTTWVPDLDTDGRSRKACTRMLDALLAG